MCVSVDEFIEQNNLYTMKAPHLNDILKWKFDRSWYHNIDLIFDTYKGSMDITPW